MPELKTSSASASNLTDAFSNVSISPETLQSPQDTNKKTEYQNTNWTIQYGYYLNTTDIQEVIDAKARWVTGKGYEADPETELILSNIRGNGKDSFNSILENMIRQSEIGGDAYSEIVRGEDDEIINIKPLNPETIKIYYSRKGMIEEYELTTTRKKWQAKDIFHIARNKLGDSMKGQSMIDVLKPLAEAKKEAMEDIRTVFHWHVKPRWKHKLKDDDPATIAAYKAKQDAAKAAGEDIYEPFDVVESELIAVPANSTLNPLAYIQYLDQAFYKSAGVPQFIVGGGTGFTEASEKIAYLAWQQTIEEYQLRIEEQVELQLGYSINLIFPASLENELLSDNKKDGAENMDQSEIEPTAPGMQEGVQENAVQAE